MNADDYNDAISALQGHSEHGVKDAELIAGARVICRTLHERFSKDGELRAGSEGAEAVERMCDGFDALATAIERDRCPHCGEPLDPDEASEDCEHCGRNLWRQPR